ncbi:MAG: type I glyceraldehyde-3-phosphate dehydrogenase [Candidatus Marinimicrobia bacterium]|nr:type I glyceraldehyde-3-phosphate dehydrogenase [Candidatus Neomarinimicrobiota bacterium]
MSKPVKIGLVGFGRIGRNLYRVGYNNPDYQFVAISDIGQPESLHYLLMRDSVHGPMSETAVLEDNYLILGDQKTRILDGGQPGSIPWDVFDVDIVIDATGKFRKKEELQKYVDAGAKRVIMTVPPVDEVDRIVVIGANEQDIAFEDRIISSTSSTVHVLTLMSKILDENFGLKRAMMTTVHAYTSDQPLADSARSDLRRSRSAVENIIPNQTWAPGIVEQIMPQFKGKLDGIAFNVPVMDGSCIDLTTELENIPTAAELNEVMKVVSEGELAGIVGYTEDPIVSSDVIGISETLIHDSIATMVINNKLVKTISWFDNGWGYSKRILETIDAYHRLEEKS